MQLKIKDQVICYGETKHSAVEIFFHERTRTALDTNNKGRRRDREFFESLPIQLLVYTYLHRCSLETTSAR